MVCGGGLFKSIQSTSFSNTEKLEHTVNPITSANAKGEGLQKAFIPLLFPGLVTNEA